MLGHWAQGKNDDVASARQVAGPDQHTHLLVFLYPGLNAGAVVMKERANPRTASHVFFITEHYSMPHALRDGIRAQRRIHHVYRHAKASLEAFPSEEASPERSVCPRAQDALLRNEESDRSPEGPYSLCIVQGPTCWYGVPGGFLRSSGDVDRRVSHGCCGCCPNLRGNPDLGRTPCLT